MTALPIVEGLDVLKNRQPSLLASLIGVPVRPLSFERAEERLHGGIIVAIAFATHADLDPQLSQHGLISAAGLLATTIGMVQQSCLGMPREQGQGPRLLDELAITMSRHRPTHHQTREEIEYHSQGEPALGSPYPCDIRDPLGVGSFRTEIAS